MLQPVDWTAITGIIVAGAVAPAVTGFVALCVQGKQQGHERLRDDVADLRALLADAAKDLRRAEGQLGGTLSLLLTYGEKIVTEASEHIEQSRATGRDVLMNDARIAIRLDDANPVAVAHRDAVAAVERAAGAIGRVGGLGGDSLVDTNAELTAARNGLTDARARFAEAARVEVGIVGRSERLRGHRLKRRLQRVDA
jgi:hypothetical protein